MGCHIIVISLVLGIIARISNTEFFILCFLFKKEGIEIDTRYEHNIIRRRPNLNSFEAHILSRYLQMFSKSPSLKIISFFPLGQPDIWKHNKQDPAWAAKLSWRSILVKIGQDKSREIKIGQERSNQVKIRLKIHIMSNQVKIRLKVYIG